LEGRERIREIGIEGGGGGIPLLHGWSFARRYVFPYVTSRKTTEHRINILQYKCRLRLASKTKCKYETFVRFIQEYRGIYAIPRVPECLSLRPNWLPLLTTSECVPLPRFQLASSSAFIYNSVSYSALKYQIYGLFF
jgi:hypothetical protein